MLNIALIILVVILLILLLLVFSRKASNDKNLASLQENLDRTRLKLAETEAQQDDLKIEISQLRIQNSGLKVQVDKVSKYQHIAEVEQYVEHRALQADGLVEVTKINADIMLQDIKSHIDEVRHFLAQYQEKAKTQVQEKAREELKSLYHQVVEQQQLQNVINALEHKVQGYKGKFFLPVQQVIDELIAGFDESDAVQSLLAVRCKMLDAAEQQQTATCNYVDEDRRLAAIHLFTLVLNSRADLYLAQLTVDNLGESLQALKDDYTLLNVHGANFSQAQVLESYLNLRLEELKLAAIVMQLKQANSAVDLAV